MSIADAVAALPPLRDVIAAHDLAARKALGQHFLLDLNLTSRVARTAGDLTGVTAIEIGPGPGGLTRALVAAGADRVVAVERDSRFASALADLVAASEGRLEIVQADALAVDVVAMTTAPRRIVANLPYNVGTPLLIGWLRQIEAFQSLTLMFQKEVVDRIVASTGTKAYGRLAVMCQWRAECRSLFDIHPSAFTPPPAVLSAVVQLVPRPPGTAPQPSFKAMETVVAAAFGQRRKMLRAALRGLVRQPEALLTAADLPATARAEEIDVDGFVRLAIAYQAGL